jgi:integrase
MLMGRPKIHDTELPRRMRKKGNSYYYVSGSKWEPLGQDYSSALIKWAEIEGMPTHQTLNEAIDLYFASDKFNTLSDNSKTAYKSRAKIIRRIMGLRTCKSILPTHLYAYMSENPSKVGANQGLIVIYHALEEARKRGWVNINHANDIEKNGTKRRGRYITDEEYKKIYEAGTDLVKAVMKLNYLIGQRPIDIFKLRLADITEEGVFIQQKKTDKKQLFLWTPELRDAIDQAKALPRPVRSLTTLFCKTTGKPYDTREFRYQWKAACKLAGVENAQFRDIRAKAGTDAYNGGQDHQAILGHTTRAMSDTYVKQFKVDKVEPLRKKI